MGTRGWCVCTPIRIKPLAETANESDDPAAGRVQGDHAGQQECEHHERRPTLPGTVSAREHHRGDAEEKRTGEEDSPRPGESKPVA